MDYKYRYVQVQPYVNISVVFTNELSHHHFTFNWSSVFAFAWIINFTNSLWPPADAEYNAVPPSYSREEDRMRYNLTVASSAWCRRTRHTSANMYTIKIPFRTCVLIAIHHWWKAVHYAITMLYAWIFK